MEKYRQFTDEKTGLNPFTPHWSSYKRGTGFKVMKLLIMGPIFLIRLVLFLIGLLWLFLSDVIIKILFVSFLQDLIGCILIPIGSYLMLFALGVLRVETAMADIRRLKMMRRNQPRRPDTPNVKTVHQQVDVVVCNFQSVVDVLYFGRYGYNSFSFMGGNGELQPPVSLFSALTGAANKVPPTPTSQLGEYNHKTSVGLKTVIFAEPHKTNGTCILPFKLPNMRMDNTRISCAHIKYSVDGAYTCHQTTTDSFVKHSFDLMYQFYQSMTVTWVGKDDVAYNSKADKDDMEYPQQLRLWVARMGVPEMTEVNNYKSNHRDFLDYWVATQGKGYSVRKKKDA